MHVVDAARLVGGAREAVIYSDAPLDVLASIDRQIVYEHHPLVMRALSSPEPFLVSEVRRDPRHAGEPWTELMAEVIKLGDALVVPVYLGDEPRAGFNFGGLRPDVTAVVRAMLQVAAHAAIDRYFELRDGTLSPSAPALSYREAQCLRGVATGKTDAELGETIGISPRTVRFHVDSAKTKLGATSRIQAVSLALRERIIAL
jgi:LuxR family quorum sensing-dependent transcriptional regulator